MMRHGWQIVILSISTISLTACGNKKSGNGDGPARWEAFPLQIATDAKVVGSAKDKADLQAAMQFWNEKVGKQIFDYQDDRWNGAEYDGGNAISQNAMYVPQNWTYASNIAAQTVVLSQEAKIKGAVIMVNNYTDFCNGDCEAPGDQNRTSKRKVFAHELGHFIGLGHSSDQANIMYPDALAGGKISQLAVSVEELRPLVR